MDKKVRNNVEKFYYDNHRVYTNEDGGQYEEEVLNIYQNDENRFHDPIYNNPNAKRQIYTFGCSWTYGWDLEQEKTFTHLLGLKKLRFIIVEQVEQDLILLVKD